MKQISVARLIPGMVTAENILSYDLEIIVPKGVILTENIISRLEEFSIYYAYIDDEITNALSIPMARRSSEIPDDSLSELFGPDEQISNNSIRKSNGFKRFSQDFAACSRHYQDILINALYHNEQLRPDDLLKEVTALLYQNGAEINIIDMLLNINNAGDSVYGHCIEVALISSLLARWLHFSDADQAMAAACGLFHDVGKFLLPASLLRKPGKLTPDEFEIMKKHTIEGYHLLGKYRHIPAPVKDAALMHHEKCDGSGYPYGLKGGETDKFSKIVTIADIFDAMTSERAYRSSICPFSVIKSFEDDGIQKYEPRYILTFLENIANTYLNHRVMLSNGMKGTVIFINETSYSRPVVRTENDEIIDLQEQYFNSMLELSNRDHLSIEAII